MSIGIAYHCEVTHHAAGINWFLNENLLFARSFGNSIHFGARVALKAKMIETRFHFVLHNY